MSYDPKSENWLRDFEAFLKEEEHLIPPRTVDQAVLAKVRADLNPPLRLVAAKLLAVHAVTTGALLLVCPQLGVGPLLLAGHGLMHVFMRFGAFACASLCGALLLGATALMATLVLRREELRLANRHSFLNMTWLVSLSFSGLMLAGGESDRFSYVFWIAGAFLAGWLGLRIGTWVKLRGAGHTPAFPA